MTEVVALITSVLAVLLYFPAAKYWLVKEDLVELTISLEQEKKDSKHLRAALKTSESQKKKWRRNCIEIAKRTGDPGLADLANQLYQERGSEGKMGSNGLQRTSLESSTKPPEPSKR